jgi:hypothetical protein
VEWVKGRVSERWKVKKLGTASKINLCGLLSR